MHNKKTSLPKAKNLQKKNHTHLTLSPTPKGDLGKNKLPESKNLPKRTRPPLALTKITPRKSVPCHKRKQNKNKNMLL